jgi:hypothetical protein
MTSRTATTLLVGALVGLGASCSSTPTDLCVPGHSVACAGPAGCSGEQVCASDGQSYGGCLCGSSAGTGSTSSGASSSPTQNGSSTGSSSGSTGSSGSSTSSSGGQGTSSSGGSSGTTGGPTASANCTESPPASQIVDASGGVYTIVGGQVAQNGVADTRTSGVTLLVYDAGLVYQLNSWGAWFSSDGTGWPLSTWNDVTAGPCAIGTTGGTSGGGSSGSTSSSSGGAASGGSGATGSSGSLTGGLTQPAGYTTKIFYDYFQGTTLNAAWSPTIGDNLYGAWPGPAAGLSSGNNVDDLEYFAPSQAVVNNGLSLVAVLDSTYPGYSWKSGSVRTLTNWVGQNGLQTYVQWRAQPPGGSGCWMGLWALDAASSGPNEIDTIESGYGSGSTPTNQIVATTVHPANNALLYNAGVDISAAYHIYGWEYLPGQWVKFYFDGVLYDTVAVSVDYPYELIMNLQMASSSDLGWHPPVDSSTPSPSVVLISGVEVWQ